MANAPSSDKPNEQPSTSTEGKVETAVRDSFPASDPPAMAASKGARAVPAEAMMDKAGSHPRRPDDMVVLTHRYPDQESAKLALEVLVREGPIDPRCAEIKHGEGGFVLRVEAAGQDRSRLEKLLEKRGAV